VVLYQNLGRILRRLHSIDPATVAAPLDGEGPVVVHGDYGAHNVVVGEDGAVAAVVDWERARRGEVVEDLAWSEWIAAVMFPVPPAAIAALYDAYGAWFTPEARRRGLDLASAAFIRRLAVDRWPPGAEWFITSAAQSFRFPDL
jgi:aminoglycoside phosphotransferase (APT) family kinase protein